MGKYSDFISKEERATTAPKSEDISYVKKGKKHESLKKKRKKKLITYSTEKEFDFLKYFIIVEYYFLNVVFKDLSPRELKFLLFLYSEPPFTLKDYNDMQEMLCWRKPRLKEWVERGYIEVYKPKLHGSDFTSNAKVYSLTKSVKRKIRSLYDKLLLRYEMSESRNKNPLFRVRARSYKDKVFAKKIKQMNEGLYGRNKDESDYVEITDHTFLEDVKDYNKTNTETIQSIREMKADDEQAEKRKKTLLKNIESYIQKKEQ